MGEYGKSQTELTAIRYQEKETDGDRYYHFYSCSNCGNTMSHTKMNYCSNCGARFIDKWYKTSEGKYINE